VQESGLAGRFLFDRKVPRGRGAARPHMSEPSAMLRRRVASARGRSAPRCVKVVALLGFKSVFSSRAACVTEPGKLSLKHCSARMLGMRCVGKRSKRHVINAWLYKVTDIARWPIFRVARDGKRQTFPAWLPSFTGLVCASAKRHGKASCGRGGGASVWGMLWPRVWAQIAFRRSVAGGCN